MDWIEASKNYTLLVSMVNQTNVDDVLGPLKNVLLDGLTITENYNSDSRVQAKISTATKTGESDGYIKNARLRITLIVPEFNFYEEMITGYVSDISREETSGYIKRTYTVEGTIWGLLDHKMKTSVVISKGAKLLTIWRGLVDKQTKMQYDINGAQDRVFGKNIIYEPASTLSTILFEISSGSDRMDVDGHGRLTLKKYQKPSEQTPSRSVVYGERRNGLKGTYKRASKEWDAPGRAIVTANVSRDRNGTTEQVVLVGSYDAPSSDPTSIDSRGWLKARSDNYSGISDNPSKAELNAEAKKNWQNAQVKPYEWTIPSIFKDYHAGEVVSIVGPTNAENTDVLAEKALIQSVSTNFLDFSQELSLKEV